MLLRFLRARGAGDSAEDLLQEIWLRVSSRDPGPIADPLPYLYRTANNLMLDRYRSDMRRQRREKDWTDSEVEHDEGPPEDRTIAAEQLAQVDALLRDLGPRVETVFRRFRLEGEGQRQIAQDLGVSLTTVEKDLQKAYRALVTLKQRFDTD